MEEEKKIEEASTEVEQLGITTEGDDSKKPFLEQRPYHNKYKSEMDIEATATAQSKDTEGTDEIQEATPEKEERPVNAEEKVFKKRYDDLKRHYDSTVNKHKDDVSKLKRQLEESAEQVLPKTKEEIEAWRTKYPDVYDVIETIAHTKADEKAKTVQTKLKDLETAQAHVSKEKAEVELSKLHPDFDNIRADDKFHEWVAKQDSTIRTIKPYVLLSVISYYYPSLKYIFPI